MKALAVLPAQRTLWLTHHPAPPTAKSTGAKRRAVIMNLTLRGVRHVITIS